MEDFIFENILFFRSLGWLFIFSLLFSSVDYLFRKNKSIPLKTILTDLLYLISNYLIAISFYTFGSIASPYFGDAFNVFSWISTLPFFAQCIINLMLIDFNGYCIHRFMHSNNITWPLHAVHHSTPEMYWLASERSHPIN